MDKQIFYAVGAIAGAYYGHQKFNGDAYKTLLSSIAGAIIIYTTAGLLVQQYQLFKVNQSLKNANQGA